MVNIIGLSLDGSDSDDQRILINTETVTHWQPAADAFAWCWAKGGHWRSHIRPVITVQTV